MALPLIQETFLDRFWKGKDKRRLNPWSLWNEDKRIIFGFFIKITIFYIYILVSDVPTWYFKPNSRTLVASILCALYIYIYMVSITTIKTICCIRKTKKLKAFQWGTQKIWKHLPTKIYIQPGLFCLVWVADSSPATHELSRTGLGSKISYQEGVL
jgi:hypothetical protein